MFTSKVIVITGGETGIGRCIAEELLNKGANVIVGGFLENEGAELAKTPAAVGGSIEFLKCDVRNRTEVDALISHAVEKYGRVDGLVCNAAVFDGFASCIETSDALWDHILNINLRGTFFACRAALRHMVEAKGGKIVNISSVGGLVGMADGASYTASKHAVIGLTKQIGCDYAKSGININAVCPGVIETNVRANSLRILGDDAPVMGGVGADPEWIKRTVPQQRKGKAKEIASMVLYLLSEESTYINGQSFAVDGGWTAK